jgi:heme-binding NEAT domain protein
MIPSVKSNTPPETKPTEHETTRKPQRRQQRKMFLIEISLVADRRLIICTLFDRVVDDGKLKHCGGTKRRSAVGKTESQDEVAIRFSIPSQISGA